MEITIPTKELIKAIELVSRISTKHITLPVLQCVLFEVAGDTIKIRATNLEISLVITLSGQVNEPGVVAVPAQTLLQSLQFITNDKVTLKEEAGVLLVELDKTNTSIKTIPHEEFPTFHEQTGQGQIIKSNLFAFAIKSTIFAASVSSIKPELSCVCVLQKKEHTLTFVATDSFRLMEKTVPQKGLVLNQSFLIPYKNAQEIARVCEALPDDPELVVTDNQLSLRFNNSATQLTARLVAGSFPDYEQIIPKEYVSTVVLLRQDLVRSFKKTNVFLNKYLQVSLALAKGEGLTISAQNNDIGHVTDSIPATVSGAELALNFNQNYINDCLAHINDDSLELKFAGVGRPLVISGISDKSFRYLVMPMNR